MATWARTFGPPEVITCLGEFIKKAAAEGIVVHQIASKAPWQQGKTERHGGRFKELFGEGSERGGRAGREGAEVEQTKNRYSNRRSGFTNHRSDNGPGFHATAIILSDEMVDPTLLDGVIWDDIERLRHMRRVAHKAFCEHNAKNTYTRKPSEHDQDPGPNIELESTRSCAVCLA